jgi:hypothetical protein
VAVNEARQVAGRVELLGEQSERLALGAERPRRRLRANELEQKRRHLLLSAVEPGEDRFRLGGHQRLKATGNGNERASETDVKRPGET